MTIETHKVSTCVRCGQVVYQSAWDTRGYETDWVNRFGFAWCPKLKDDKVGVLYDHKPTHGDIQIVDERRKTL